MRDFWGSPQGSFKIGLIVVLLLSPIAVWYVAASGFSDSRDGLPETVEFNRHIRPILSNKCFVCHGPDPGTREADLRLDIPEEATAQREGYERPAIVPGSPGQSMLIRMIKHSDPEKRMPPLDSGKMLLDHEIVLLEKWIEQGAKWQDHWSYIPPRRPELPAVTLDAVIHNPIDRFIVARLEKAGLEPSPEADPVTLIRRLYFDLTGIPPTPEEVDSFVSDTAPDAYEKVVERLLASPHFGERMAMKWLDLVRFADTDGYHSDLHRDLAAYRDYVIDSFNRNKAFDQFTREQIAGDLIPNATLEQKIASGFNRLGQATKEGGAQPKEYLARYAGDRVRTVSTAWLGSTIGCAECHDHKFDPFTQKDFYSMAAFFADVKERGVYRNENGLPPEIIIPDRQKAAALREMDREIERLRRSGASASVVQAAVDRQGKELEDVPRTLVTRSIEPRVVRVLPRGNWKDDSGEIVAPDVPEFLPDIETGSGKPTRMDLADWIVSEENPLTARVFVNHLWSMYFGTGLSKVLDDLGSQGEWPTHPDLLDWMAVEFMESGWDVKHMVRLIVTSATYRQSSKTRPEIKEVDPENRLLARQSRFRLDAEVIRDNALAVSGLLAQQIGGPSVKQYQPAGYWSDIRTFGTDGPASQWVASEDTDQYRRGLYTYWKRSFLHPSMMAFDAPDRQECTALRARSNTPLQALVLLNDSTYVEAARVFAEHILQEGGTSFEERLQWAWHRALSRKAETKEAAEMRTLYEEEHTWYAEHRQDAEKLILTGQKTVPETVDETELAAWTAVARGIMNLHEFVTRF